VAKTYDHTTGCIASPAHSSTHSPISVTHPLRAPISKNRTARAAGRLVVRPKQTLPRVTATMLAIIDGRRPQRSAAWPHRIEVKSRPQSTAVGSRPATKPAVSASAAQPQSTARKPAYEKMEQRE